MKLLTKEIAAQLAKNGKEQAKVAGTKTERDFIPVVKFFNPCGAQTWLITESDPDDPDILFGLCDLGLDCAELGSVRLSELESVKGPLGLGIERDLHFHPTKPLSVYAKAAYAAGRIVESV